jgi:hypothetical protein
LCWGMVKRQECSSSLENFRATSCGGTRRTWYIRSQLTIEVLRKRVENATTTIRNNREMLERVEESFRRLLLYCIDNIGGHFDLLL